jgi:hypothetical protein
MSAAAEVPPLSARIADPLSVEASLTGIDRSSDA